MNKKTYLRTIVLIVTSVIFSILLSGIVNRLFTDKGLGFQEGFNYVIVEGINYFFALIFMFTLVPAIYHLLKAKRRFKHIDQIADEDIDEYEVESKKSIDKAIMFNAIHMILVMTVSMIGVTRDISELSMYLALAYIGIVVLFVIIIEYSAVGTLQKFDSRIKGDPSKFNFYKEYLDSCDEAEQFKIYKTAYKSYQFTKHFTYILFVFAGLITMKFNVSPWALIFIAAILLVQILSYCIHSFAKEYK